MIRALSIVTAGAGLLALAFAACGGDGGSPRFTPTPIDAEETPPPLAASPTPAEPPTQIRVAYVNLQSPLVVDANDPVAAETYEQRLQLMIDALKAFRPDIVGVSEATWTRDTGQAWATIAAGLGMEAQFGRSNPWYPGQTLAESDQTRDLIGFEEGEAILSRFPILEGARIALNPRTSESEGRAAVRVTVLVPGIGPVDVYVARLAGDASQLKEQAVNLSLNIEITRGQGPRIIMADMGMGPGETPVQLFTAQRYFDAASAAPEDADLGTCCRSQILLGGGSTPTPPGISPTASPSPTGDLEATPTPTVVEAETAMTKTMYIFADRWRAIEFGLLADEPSQLPDGSQLYASDHNGIGAVLVLDGGGVTSGNPRD